MLVKPDNLKPHLKEVYDIVEEKAVTAEDETDIPSISDIAGEDHLDITRQTASKRLERLKEKGLVKVLPTPGEATKYVPADFDETLDPVKQRKEKLRQARKTLKERILREPTVEEVAEELGEPFNDRFEKEFLASVENYRRPSEEQIERAKKELEGMLRRCLTLYHGARPEDLKPENLDTRPVGKEYLEKNEEIFNDFTLTGIGYNEHGQAEIRVEPPNYIAKFLEKPKFTLSTTTPEEFDLDHGEDTL